MNCIRYASVLLALAFFWACAPMQFPRGKEFLNGRVVNRLSPDSLRVELEVLPVEPGSFPLQTRLYAKPNVQYRLDIMGLTSVAGTFKWDTGQWLVVIHQNREIIFGQGDSMQLPGQAFVIPDIHAALGFLWEQPMPWFLQQDSGSFQRRDDTVFWSHKGEPWWARLELQTGVCLEVHSEHWSIRYGSWHRFGALHVPRKAEVFLNNKLQLRFLVKRVEANPAWKKNPFHMPLPPQYRQRKPLVR